MSRQSRIWFFVLGLLVAGQIVAALLLPQGFAATALSDVVVSLVLFSAALACLPVALKTRGRTRFFWLLMAVAQVLWFAYQVIWTYFEIYLRREVPALFSGDIVLFLHIVPMMAGLALQPHREQDDRTTRFGALDFTLLLVWWVFLFVFSVLPWQYVSPNELYYNQNLNVIYMAEKLVLLGALALVWFHSSRSWKGLYAHLFGASLGYGLSSYLANWAIEKRLYHTGSLYDVPLVAAMAWFSVIPLLARESPPKQQSSARPAGYGVWVARLGMVAVSSLPLFALWSLFDGGSPARVQMFRLQLTLATILVMGALVFLKQNVADRELLRLLRTSQQSLEDLRVLQLELVQSEKLASMGQLVGGAAHELNNPLTAMLGYAELLVATPLDPDERLIAEKIGQQVRKTKALVASLLSFAHQAPAEKSELDVSALVRTAINHCAPQLGSRNVEIHTDLASDLPPVRGDSNQLLQVCLRMADDRLHALEERCGGRLTITTRRERDSVVLEFCDSGPASQGPEPAVDLSQPPRSLNEEMGLGLSACHAIISEHGGQISCSRREGGAVYRIELPALTSDEGAEAKRDKARAAAFTPSPDNTLLP